MGNKKLFLLAGILSVLTALAVFVFLNQVQTAASKIKYLDVVVAREDIPAKTLVTKDMLETRKVAQDYVHAKALTNNEDAIGKITRADISLGEQLLSTKLVGSDNTGSGLSFIVPAGKRAVSVPVNEVTGVSALLKAGDVVDVLGTIDLESTTKKATATHLLLENVQVLAIGQNMDAGKVSKEKTDKTETQQQTVTLAVPADQVQKLVLMTERGTITLSLRTPVDKNQLKRPPVEKGIFWPK